MTLVDDFYRDQARTAQRSTIQLAAVWAALDPEDLDGTWAVVRQASVLALAALQTTAAATAQAYLEQVLREAGILPAPLATLRPQAFAGMTSDGRPLDTLADLALVDSKLRIGAGEKPSTAIALALLRFQLAAHTETQDASRVALGSGMVLEPSVRGYVRHVRLPACDRCILLSGRWYRFSAGFLRHPRCDCAHLPDVGDRPDPPDPDQLFNRLGPAQQERAFGKAGAAAIREGADVGQVVNAKRGMRTAGDRWTTEGTTKRGIAGKKLASTKGYAERSGRDRYGRARVGRLSPAALLNQYGDDRERYRLALAANGYL